MSGKTEPTDEAYMSLTDSGLSLFRIEAELAEVIEFRESATTPEEMAAADLAILQYAEREVKKVDGVRAYLRNCDVMAAAAKEEASRQMGNARAWESRRDRLKQAVQYCMASFGVKKLEGKTGTLQVKGNGGVQPLVIDEHLVTNQFKKWTIELDHTTYHAVMRKLEQIGLDKALITAAKITSMPNKEMIRAALERGEPVAGARLDERGSHLEVR